MVHAPNSGYPGIGRLLDTILEYGTKLVHAVSPEGKKKEIKPDGSDRAKKKNAIS
jgi:hypothetical protein